MFIKLLLDLRPYINFCWVATISRLCFQFYFISFLIRNVFSQKAKCFIFVMCNNKSTSYTINSVCHFNHLLIRPIRIQQRIRALLHKCRYTNHLISRGRWVVCYHTNLGIHNCLQESKWDLFVGGDSQLPVEKSFSSIFECFLHPHVCFSHGFVTFYSIL